MNDVEIRRALPNEQKVVQELNHELLLTGASKEAPLDPDWSFSTDAERYFDQVISGGDGGICLVAEKDGQIVGYLAGCVRKPIRYRPILRGELENMFVSGNQRGEGIGRKLVLAFKSWSRDQGAPRCVVDTFAISDEARTFYHHMGFSSDGVEMESAVE